VSAPGAAGTVTELLLAQAGSSRPGLLFEDRRWTWQEHVTQCARFAAALRARRRPGLPFHVAVLADNVPEFSFLLGGCAFAGAVLVALNPVRRGAALARDVARTDCQYVLAEPQYATLLPAMDVPVLPLDDLELPERASVDPAPVTPDDLLMLIFTSGTSGEPKAVRCTHGKIAVPGRMLADRFGLTAADTVYVSMPMFHSNAIMAGWAVGLAAGAAIALRRRFSASGFMADVRAFGATYANYVGKPLSYVLATPERDDDADNPLRIAYGNEGAPGDLARFAGRFGCLVVDGFGSTEGGVAVSRTPDTPPGALGKLADGVALLDPQTGRLCPPARFGPRGELLNAAEAVGEFVNTAGAGMFAGYYNDPGADASRMRDGMYWSGDLGYADSRGFCWFAGRAGNWLRVDGDADVQGAHPGACRRPVEHGRSGVVAPGPALARIRPPRPGAGGRARRRDQQGARPAPPGVTGVGQVAGNHGSFGQKLLIFPNEPWCAVPSACLGRAAALAAARGQCGQPEAGRTAQVVGGRADRSGVSGHRMLLSW
jgi:fatty-acyl-CoA synthase